MEREFVRVRRRTAEGIEPTRGRRAARVELPDARRWDASDLTGTSSLRFPAATRIEPAGYVIQRTPAATNIIQRARTSPSLEAPADKGVRGRRNKAKEKDRDRSRRRARDRKRGPPDDDDFEPVWPVIDEERIDREREEQAANARVEEEAAREREREELARDEEEAAYARQREETKAQEAAARLEKERLEKERAEKERLEKEEAERLENERLEKERLEKERLEKEEAERLENERLEKERLEKERLEKEEAERLENERLEKERLEKEQLEKELAWVGSMGNQAMAQTALDRAKLDPTKAPIPHAAAIYDHLYTVLGFQNDPIGRITAANAEQDLLDLHAGVLATEWTVFLAAATKSTNLLAFARAHHVDFHGIAEAGAVLRCMCVNPANVTTVADAHTLLALALVNHDADIGIRAARLLGTLQIPTLAALTALVNSALFVSIAEIVTLQGLGGDVTCNKRMLSLVGGTQLQNQNIIDFNNKCGTTVADAVQCWTDLSANVADDVMRNQLIRSVIKAPNATRADFLLFVHNFVALSDRTTIISSHVVTLVGCGMLVPGGSAYTSGEWGKGCVYTFFLLGGGRLRPEWHIHYSSAGGNKAANTVGAGWKNKEEKKKKGVKTYTTGNTITILLDCIQGAGKLFVVKI